MKDFLTLPALELAGMPAWTVSMPSTAGSAPSSSSTTTAPWPPPAGSTPSARPAGPSTASPASP